MSELAQALGQKLKAERERRGVSAQKMADDMHLDAWVIDALESGDYQRIGPSVYAKGHLRKYAGILGVSTAEPGAEPKPPPTGGIPPMPIIRMDRPPALSKSTVTKLGGLAALVLLAAGILWWRPWHRAPAATAATAAAAQPPAAAGAGTSAALQGPNAGSAAVPSEPAPEAEPSPDTPGVSAAAAQAGAIPVMLSKPAELSPGVGRARLRVSFSAAGRSTPS